jgi:hypothetical protein
MKIGSDSHAIVDTFFFILFVRLHSHSYGSLTSVGTVVDHDLDAPHRRRHRLHVAYPPPPASSSVAAFDESAPYELGGEMTLDSLDDQNRITVLPVKLAFCEAKSKRLKVT